MRRTVLIWLVGCLGWVRAADPGWESDVGGIRWRSLAQTAGTAPGFTLLSPETTGLRFTNSLTDAASAANRVLENGCGVALGDFDDDGRPDIFLCGLSGNSGLFRNLADWRFANVTEAVGLHLRDEVCRGAVFADINGDGRLDLLVSTLARGVLCFLNDGGRFLDATASAGTGGFPGSTTLALADVDGNGTLDLYVARYRAEDIRDSSNVEARNVGGRPVLHPKYQGRLLIGPRGLIEFGEADVLYLNDGTGHFREVPWTGGTFLDEDGDPLPAAPLDWGLTAAFRDVNGDGAPDLYVCNDYWTPDRFWLNTGDGHFRAASLAAVRHTSENSMGVDFGDLDRDGNVDFLVLDMLSRDLRLRRREALAQTPMTSGPGVGLSRPQVMRNTLFRNRGDGTFAEVAAMAGLSAADWAWQPLLVDVDLDGLEDVLAPAGHRRDVQDLDATERIRALQHPWPAGQDPTSRQQAFTREMAEHGRLYPGRESPVVAFRNQGGFRFEEVTSKWGLAAPGVHQGAALADLDGDGDLDLVVNNLGTAAGCYRNDGAAARVAVRLRGLGANRSGVGARVRLRGGAVPEQSAEVAAGGRYLSGSEMRLVFAAGAGEQPMSLEVRWRSGRVSHVAGVRAGRLYEIDETTAVAAPAESVVRRDPWFEDRTGSLQHTHSEDVFDDLARQPLLPRRLSQEGPGVCVADLDGDGFDDLVIGAGAGGRWGVFTNDHRGGWAAAPAWFGNAATTGDQAGLVALHDARGGVALLVGVSNYESPQRSTVAAQEFRAGVPPVDLPGIGSSTGPLALGDLAGDGTLAVFVGGRVVAGRYPEMASSQIFRRTASGWQRDERNTEILRDVGLVTAAAWGDLDDDGRADLVLACEWGPVRVYRNEGGGLREVTREWGLAEFTGWWQCLTLGDLDGDGRFDVLAGNWGLNSGYEAQPGRPAVILYGDLLDRGGVDVLETEWDPVRGVLAPRRRLDELAGALPTLRALFRSHAEYSEASVEEVARRFGKRLERVEARTLASTVFFNRGRRFEAMPLPDEAQVAPAMGVVVADFDGDGVEDAFLAQNFFALPWQVSRLDAGRGLLLRGLGGGKLEPESAVTTGLEILGEQRGTAVGDFDRDGRVDLVVAQNGGETRVFRNRRGVPGLRVRLRGGAGNPAGIGAVVRVRTAKGWGPARGVLGGSGRWSQSSTVSVLATDGGPAEVQVRWSDGATTRTTVAAGDREVVVERARAARGDP